MLKTNDHPFTEWVYDLVGDKEELKQYLVGYVCDAWDEDEGNQGSGGM